MYVYKILAIGTHTETKHKQVVYEALYTNEDQNIHEGDIFIRPYDMFMSEVDKRKYPNARQKFRFEKYNKGAIL